MVHLALNTVFNQPDEYQRSQREESMLVCQIDPNIPFFMNGAVFYEQIRTPVQQNGKILYQTQPVSEVLLLGTNVSPMWDQKTELLLERILLCQGTENHRGAGWSFTHGTLLFNPPFVDQRDHDLTQKGIHPPLRISEEEATSMMVQFLGQGIALLEQQTSGLAQDLAILEKGDIHDISLANVRNSKVRILRCLQQIQS